MDNASKALIMAGAILISIAIVGVGVYIFSSTSNIGKTGAKELGAVEAQMANSNLRQYAGSRVRGSQVKSFMAYVEVLNANDTLPIDLEYTSGTGCITDASTIIDNAFYSLKLEDKEPSSALDSYYDTITITAATATPATPATP